MDHAVQTNFAARRYHFTINNPTDEDVAELALLEDAEVTKYLVYGRETAPTTGTPHLQGFISLQKKTRIRAFRTRLSRAYVASCNGSNAQNVTYCKKGGNFHEWGQLRQGRRTDLDVCRQAALEGGMRLVTQRSSYQQIRTAAIFLVYHEPPRDWLMEVTWYYGPTGKVANANTQADHLILTFLPYSFQE